MTIDIKAYTNCDDAFIVWQPSEKITDCRGFALYRYKKNQDGTEKMDIIPTWVGFEDESVEHGTQKPSTQWPIQRFLWTDYLVQNGDIVCYQAVPMIGSEKNMKASEELASLRTNWVTVGTDGTQINAFFNRGIVASQWLSRRLDYIPPSEEKTKLRTIIATPNSTIRNFLAGEIRNEMLKILAAAKNSNSKIYASLFELNDPDLIDALKEIGSNANVVLANGSHKTDCPDVNSVSRTDLKENSKVNVYDRIVTGNHLSHHKFLVICDSNDRPQKVWTGSTNWSVTGLCTQANNGILLESPEIASWFKNQWNMLRDAGSGYPSSLIDADSNSRSVRLGDNQITAWFTPLKGELDLQQARQFIKNAQQGILFLMFNPGPKGTLLNDILDMVDSGLFIHGVVNQDPGGKQPLLTLFNRGQQINPDADVIIPAAINDHLKYWEPELKNYSIAMVHSKVIIVDPFGAKPVVMTGSHNMGPKASTSNDDNLVIIENSPSLASQYAVNIMSIYNQYKWRHNQLTQDKSQQWTGLVDKDDWQDYLLTGARLDEVQFWLGKYQKKK